MNMPIQQTFDGEEHISIDNNKYLSRICDHILSLRKRTPDLISGKNIGEIYSKVTLAIWYDEGFGRFIPEDRREAFSQWFTQTRPKPCPSEDSVARALRHLIYDLGIITLPANIILDAERHRQRIGGGFRKRR